jgi:uncharacterized membrane protein YhaH (DUF805 family)
MNELLSLRGRFTRSKYILTTLAITLVTYGLAFVVGIVMGVAGLGEDTAGMVGGFLGMTAQVVVAFVVVKRLHDLDRPGWHFWLLLVPLYNIYLSIVMLFVKGTTGTNQFGPDPMVS